MDHPVLGDRTELRRGEEQNIGHDAEIRPEVGERLLRLVARISGKAMDHQPAFLCRHYERIRSGPGSLRRGENAGDLVSARDKGFEHGFAERLLTDDDDAHLLPSDFPDTARGRTVSCRSTLGQVRRANLARLAHGPASRQ